LDKRFTIIVGGKAGEGVKKAVQVIAEAFNRLSYHTFQMDDYQSLIKGGHNFSVVTAAQAEVFSAYEIADLIICFDSRSVVEHKIHRCPETVLVYNSDDGFDEAGIGVPLSALAKIHLEPGANVSISAISVFCGLFGLGRDFLVEMVKDSYRKNVDANIAYASAIYESLKVAPQFLLGDHTRVQTKQMSGNQLIALGAYAAGLDQYYGYPMTPASSLMHYLASKKEAFQVQTIHAESELAAINMAIGATYAGARTAVGSSGGGFALMQEAFSMAGIVEAPLLCVLSSRPGPATGVSTYTAQEDLMFALYQGHGEFVRVVASPDSHIRAFSLAAELLSLAWELQCPTLLLTEKHLSECMQSIVIDPNDSPFADYKKTEEPERYERYSDSADGVSPLLFPPSAQMIKWNSHEHLASGLRTDQAEAMLAIKDKRNRKFFTAQEAIAKYQRIATYGEGEFVVFAYGSTVLELREAAKHVDFAMCIVGIIYLEPFPTDLLAIYKGKSVVVVEHSSRGAFAEFLKSKLQIDVLASILKYDGRSYDPLKLASHLQEVYDAQS